MYHRFGNDLYPSTNIKLNQFNKHIKELKRDKYNVLPLSTIVDSIKNNRKLPKNSIAITIDDAYISIYEKAWPILKDSNLTFTIFVNTDLIDANSKNYMSWEQLRELVDAGVEIGNHTATHPYMIKQSLKNNLLDIKRANRRFKEELGFIPKLFAYPYGEFNIETKKLIKDMGFLAGFGQHSGVVNKSENIYGLPRFSLNEKYGNIDRFKFILNINPLRIYNFKPLDTIINIENNPFKISFEIDESLNAKNLNCYISNEGRVDSNIIKNKIILTPKKKFNRGRSKLNCTLFENNIWYWYGYLFIN